MAKIRNVSSDARYIGYGVTHNVWVEPDETVDVHDDALEGYTIQTEIWAAVPDVAVKSSPPASVSKAAPVQKVTE